MAIYCSRDGTEHPDDSNFCRMCGRPLHGGATAPPSGQSPMRWEYKELVAPLGEKGLKWSEWLYQHINQYVLAALQREGQGGWQADGPTDYESLNRGGRVTTHMGGWFGGDKIYDAVTIRLKRLVPG